MTPAWRRACATRLSASSRSRSRSATIRWRQTDIEATAGAYAGERPHGRAANMPATRPRKPADEDTGPHNWGGGEARPKGGGRMRRRR